MSQWNLLLPDEKNPSSTKNHEKKNFTLYIRRQCIGCYCFDRTENDEQHKKAKRLNNFMVHAALSMEVFILLTLVQEFMVMVRGKFEKLQEECLEFLCWIWWEYLKN
ncbi:unnamed protein product [Lactuca virosa]|uniref:Uncharacterized protein n=1 Tax=Lactuca virosa TaxID=75947 RepID=A0AAU9MGI5_9ASTR|nr:unnamed protein product [Lactuca virosa]